MFEFVPGTYVRLAQPVLEGPGQNDPHPCPTRAQLEFIADSIGFPEPFFVAEVQELPPQERQVARHPLVLIVADAEGEESHLARSRHIDPKGEYVPLVLSGIWFQAA